ncbi:MAG: lipoate--protein ligase family protein [Deltaproteobacteria bacterium]|nr:lipoate--protein ligase family protein [Deltaproteobacteria bacterium]
MDQWRFLSYGEFSAFENMAIDEAIFRENQCKDNPPTLRFYGWRSPSVSVGYFQDMSKEVDLEACRKNRYDVVRRPTGGKAVFHYNDLTYAIVARSRTPPFTDDILGTYKVISHCLARGLEKVNIKAQMAEKKRDIDDNAMEAFCFSVPSRYELLVDGKKICGSAQVRSHGSFLQHGSLMISFDAVKTQAVLLPHLDRDKQVSELLRSATSIADCTKVDMDVPTICCVLKEGMETALNIRLIEGQLTAGEEVLKKRLLKKYQDLRWTMEGGITTFT